MQKSVTIASAQFLQCHSGGYSFSVDCPTVSIVVPVYNMELYLGQCIDSILVQTYRNFEIVLVDDGSTDDSGGICDRYAAKDFRVKVIHKRNGGVSTARNAGIAKCRGEYIMFVDSDDVLLDSKTLEYCVNEIEQDQQIDFIQYPMEEFSNAEEYTPDSNRGSAGESVVIAGVRNIYETMFVTYVLNAYLCGKLFRRRVVPDSCMRDSFSLCEDGLFFLDHAETFSKVKKISKGLYGYRQRPQSGSRTWNVKTCYQHFVGRYYNFLRAFYFECDRAVVANKWMCTFFPLGETKAVKGIDRKQYNEYVRVLKENCVLPDTTQISRKSREYRWAKLISAVGVKNALTIYVLLYIGIKTTKNGFHKIFGR